MTIIHVRICVYVCTYVCMYVCTYVSMYVCMYVRTYVCTCVCMYVCMYRYVRMYVHIYISPTDNWQKEWSNWRQKMKDIMSNATDVRFYRQLPSSLCCILCCSNCLLFPKSFCLAKTVDESTSEVIRQTTLAGFHRAAKSSIEVMNETVKSIEPTLQL